MPASRASRTVRTIIVVLGIVITVAVAGFFLITDEAWKRIVAAGITSLTDRECAIEGDFDIGFFPAVTMRAQGFRLANAAWSERPSMVAARELEVAIDTARLFSGILDVRLMADMPVISVEYDADGVSNWDLAKRDDAEPSRWRPVFRDVRLNDARVILADAREPETMEIVFTEFRLGTEGDQLVVQIDGSDGGFRTRLGGTLGNADAILDGRPTRINLEGAVGASTLALDGNLSGLTPWPALEADVRLQVQSLQDFAPFVAGNLPDLGPVVADLRLSGESGRYAAPALRIDLDDPRARAHLEGTIDDLVELQGIALSARLDTGHLQEILAELDIESPVPPPQMVAFSGRVAGDRERLALDDIDLRTEDADVSATFSGRIADVTSLRGIQGDVNVKAAGSSVLSRYLQAELPELGAVDLSATLTPENGTFQAHNLVLSISGGQVSGQVTGGIADLRAFERVDVTLDLDIATLAALSPFFGTELADTPPFTLDATLSAPAGIGGPAAIDGTIRNNRLSVSAKGNVANLAAFAGIDAALAIQAESVAVLNPLLELDLPSGIPLQVQAGIKAKADSYTLNKAKIRVGETEMLADLEWQSAARAGGDRPVVTGKVDIDILDLSGELTLDVEFVEPAPTEVPQEGAEEQFALKFGESDRLFSSAPLALGAFSALEAELALTVRELYTADAVIEHIEAGIELKNGRLAIDPINAGAGGSHIGGSIVIDAGKSPPRFSVDVKGDAVTLRRFTGTYNFLAKLDGQGGSVSELMEGLDGRVVVTAGGITIVSSRLTDVERDVRERLDTSDERSETTEIECLFARLDINEGIVDAKQKIIVQTKDVTWFLGGEIDLKSETIKMVADSKSRRGLGLGILSRANLVGLILIQGTLSEPVFMLDPAGLAGQTAYYTAAAATGGLSMLLIGLFDQAQADRNVCGNLLEEKGGSGAPEGNGPAEEKTRQPESGAHWEH